MPARSAKVATGLILAATLGLAGWTTTARAAPPKGDPIKIGSLASKANAVGAPGNEGVAEVPADETPDDPATEPDATEAAEEA